MHGPEEVAFANGAFDRIEDLLGLPRHTLKIGVHGRGAAHHHQPQGMHPRRARPDRVSSTPAFSTAPATRSTPPCGPGRWCAKAPCATSAGSRPMRTGTSPRAWPAASPARRRSARACGRRPTAWPTCWRPRPPTPMAGANAAWVPSPTAAVLHALHYHQVRRGGPPARPIQRPGAIARRADRDPGHHTRLVRRGGGPGAGEQRPEHPRYVVRWIDQGIGCSKVPDNPRRRPDGGPRHPAHLQPAHRQLADATASCSREQVLDVLRRMAVVVDRQERRRCGLQPDGGRLRGQRRLPGRLRPRVQGRRAAQRLYPSPCCTPTAASRRREQGRAGDEGRGRGDMTILVTGAAGFIGFHTCAALLDRGETVVGLDNLNDYYEVSLKQARLARLEGRPGFRFARLDLADRPGMAALFAAERPDRVVHLAAQAGVRYSLENPEAYVDSNVVGFLSVLQGCPGVEAAHLVFASTSSVFGANAPCPSRSTRGPPHPLTLYAATKLADEGHGPRLRPPLRLPVHGPAVLHRLRAVGPARHGADEVRPRHPRRRGRSTSTARATCSATSPTSTTSSPACWRRWTARRPSIRPGTPAGPTRRPAASAPWRILNLGAGSRVELMRYIEVLEQRLGRKATLHLMPMQAGDVTRHRGRHQRHPRRDRLPADHGRRGRRGEVRGLVCRLLWPALRTAERTEEPR